MLWYEEMAAAVAAGAIAYPFLLLTTNCLQDSKRIHKAAASPASLSVIGGQFFMVPAPPTPVTSNIIRILRRLAYYI